MKKNFVPLTALVPGLLGFAALFNNLGKERVALLRGSDVFGLVAAGFCFGVCFTMLLSWYTTRKERNAAG